MENDYSQLEIDSIVNELMTVQIAKLKPEEIEFLIAIEGKKVAQAQRDKVIKLYDSIGEAGY